MVRKAIPPLLDRFNGTFPLEGRNARDLFRDMMAEVYQYLVEGSEARVILRLLIAEGRRFPELVAFYYSEVVVRGNAALTRVVELGVSRGEFSVDVNNNVSRVLISPLISAVFWQLLFSDIEKIDVKQLFEVHINLALHGLIGDEKRYSATPR